MPKFSMTLTSLDSWDKEFSDGVSSSKCQFPGYFWICGFLPDQSYIVSLERKQKPWWSKYLWFLQRCGRSLMQRCVDVSMLKWALPSSEPHINACADPEFQPAKWVRRFSRNGKIEPAFVYFVNKPPAYLHRLQLTLKYPPPLTIDSPFPPDLNLKPDLFPTTAQRRAIVLSHFSMT
jgi:hypothetical protein